MIDVLILAAVLAQGAQQLGTTGEVEVGVLVTFTDGATQRVSSSPRNRGVLYIPSNATLCSDPTLGSTPPEGKSFGWKVELEPAGNNTRITWRRLEGAAETRGAKNGIRTLPIDADGAWWPLDHLDIGPTAGCKMQHWSLVARRTPVEAMRPKLLEAELWFVHKAPDGKETSQHQTVRLRGATRTSAGSNSEFYFDDLVVNATIGDRVEPVTVEVFGSLMLFPTASDKEINAGIHLTRRYINPKATALGIPPTVGTGNHSVMLEAGEVVSFVLPPLENDKGHVLGHRFSVRLRLKPLGPEGD